MIISRDIHPERDFYYLGAKTIDAIISLEKKEFDYFVLFEKLNEVDKVSVNLYAFTLDWLYLIGVIDKSENGRLKRCF